MRLTMMLAVVACVGLTAFDATAQSMGTRGRSGGSGSGWSAQSPGRFVAAPRVTARASASSRSFSSARSSARATSRSFGAARVGVDRGRVRAPDRRGFEGRRGFGVVRPQGLAFRAQVRPRSFRSRDYGVLYVSPGYVSGPSFGYGDRYGEAPDYGYGDGYGYGYGNGHGGADYDVVDYNRETYLQGGHESYNYGDDLYRPAPPYAGGHGYPCGCRY